MYSLFAMSYEELKEVEIAKISLNPHQPRSQFSHEDLQELADSIKQVGLLHPPLVRATKNNTHYELISGERRLRACKLAGFTSIPVVIVPYNYEHSAQAALIENIQRSDLNPLEIAIALKKLIEQYGWTQEKLSEHIGKKRSTVANYLRLLTLQQEIQEAIRQESISMGHAKAILSMKTPEEQLRLCKKVLQDNLTVRETENVGHKALTPRKKALSAKDVHLAFLEEKIQAKIGTKVTIQGKNSKGKISMDYYSFDDLDRILSALAIDLSL